METIIGKALVGLEQADLSKLQDAMKSNDEATVITLILAAELSNVEFDALMAELNSNFYNLLDIVNRVHESMYAPKAELTHVNCAELCCDGSYEKFGPGRSKITKTVVNKNSKTVKLVVVDEKGKEL